VETPGAKVSIGEEMRRSHARLMLMMGRCHQQMGQQREAYRFAARVIEAEASYSQWVKGEVRMMATVLGECGHGSFFSLGGPAEAASVG
jgi:hypothetical protein